MKPMIEKDDPRLTAFVLGELSESVATEIQNAIANSPELSSAVDEIRQTVELLGAGYASESPLALLDQQRTELAQAGVDGADAKVNLKENGPKDSIADRSVTKANRPWLPIVLAASLLCVLVGGAYYLNNPPVDEIVAAGLEKAGEMSRDQLKALKAKSEVDVDSQLESMVSQYNDLVDEERFEEAKAVVQKAVELAPENEISVLMNEKARIISRLEKMNEIRSDKESGNWSALEASDSQLAELRSAKIQASETDFAKADEMNDSVADLAELPREELAQESELTELSGGMEFSQGRGIAPDNRPGGMGGAGQRPSSNLFVDDRFTPLNQADLKFDAGSFQPTDEGKSDRDEIGDMGGGVGGNVGGRIVGDFAIAAQPQDNPAVMLPAKPPALPAPASEPAFGETPIANSGKVRIARQRAVQPTPSAADSTLGDEAQAAGSDSEQTLKMMQQPTGSKGKDIERAGDATINDAEKAPTQVAQESELKKNRANSDDGAGELGGEKQSGEVGAPGRGGNATGGGFEKDQSEKGASDPARRQMDSDRDLETRRKAAELEAQSKKEATQQAQELGLKAVTKMVPIERTRVVPVQRMRTETKTRDVPVTHMRTVERTSLVDGKPKIVTEEVPYTVIVQQTYEIQVPFTENVTQSYTIEVPQTVLTLDDAQADGLIEELAKDFDPNRKREFQLQELIVNSVKTLEKNDNKSTAGKKTPSRSKRLAETLYDDLTTRASGKASELKFDSTELITKLNESLQKRNAEVRRTRTWKRVKAVPNTTRLMVGDKDELDLTGMQVNVQVDGFRARVLLDYFYYNNRGEQLEGNFKLRLPDDASLYYFAFGESAYDLQPKGGLAKEEFLDDGTQFVSLGADNVRKARDDSWKNVKEARMVPREKAAHAYRETVRRKIDPALVEWSGAGVFNARVFPLAPHKLHRIVIGYDVNLTKTDDGWTYELDLPEQTGQCQVDLNVQPVDGFEYQIQPDADPIENVVKGKTHKRFRFLGKQEAGIQLTAKPTDNERSEILLHSSNDEEGDFWAIQVKPDLPVEEVAGSPVGIFMVDTSLSSNPDKFNVWLSMLRSTLTNNRDSLKHFNVLFFNVDGHFWQDGYVANTQENVEKLMQACDKLALEGATDLYGAIEKITKTPWVYQPAGDTSGDVKQQPDLFLLSDGAATWGETNLRLMGRLMDDNNLGSMFAYQTGLTGTSISGLRFLTGQTGGAVFSVTTEDEIKSASMAHRKRPWRLESVSADGATDTMTAGRVQWVYPGQSVTVVGRGTVEGGIKLNLDQAGEEKTISISPKSIERVESELASRLYGQVAVGQLESLGAKVFDVAASYARHFRVTGDTCSLLMLESEQEYQQFGIKPEEDLFVIKSKVAKDLVQDVLDRSANELSDPKAQMVAWLDRLETMPGMSFKMPTALKLSMDDIEVVAISKPLNCSLIEKGQVSDTYIDALKSERLDYATIAAEANRRGGTSIDEAIKVFSSLVERNPGDLVIARDVAFTAMELDRPAQAYHLLRRIAKARPFQGSVYPALGQCLTQLGQADMAIVYYEVALGGTFQRQGENFKDIVSAEYMYLLRKVVSGEMESSVKDFAKARLATMKKNMKFTAADVVITMMWNTDQTDVDLHVLEPSGEECSYENKRTRSNGQITSDITTGFGPEMYFNADAPKGKYDIKVKYFSNGQNRTELRNKVHLTIYRGFGTDQERVDRRTIQLKKVGEKESVATIGID